jgi:hypothetical protein
MRNARILSFFAAFALAAGAFAAAPSVSKLLPTKAELKTWAPIADSLTCVKKDKLEDIYNGGSNVYRDHGVQEAAQQMYQRKNDIMEISVMSIDTPANAKKFYNYWKNSANAKVLFKSKHGEGFMFSKTPYTGYVYAGNHLATVMPAYSGKTVQKDVTSILKSISTKLEKAVKK